MRLIDANALLEKLKQNLRNYRDVMNDDGARATLIAVNDVEKAPTIDAESVVRCKNCRFGTQSKQEPKDYFVRCIHNPFYPEHFHKNHYCGFGLKKDEEQE